MVEKHEGLMAEVRRMEERWIEAYLGGDVEGFAEDFVYTCERGVFDEQSYVRNLASGVIEMRGPRNDGHEGRLHGSTASSTGAATLREVREPGHERGGQVPACGGRGRRLARRRSAQQRPGGGLSRR